MLNFDESSRELASSTDIYWTEEYLAANTPDSTSLPTSEILSATFDQFGALSLEPSQRPASKGADTPAAEHILALYCPIEGGDYLIDNTVRELGRRFKADVVILDSAHLAAGCWGHYKAMGALLDFTKNPLLDQVGLQNAALRPQDATPASLQLFFKLFVNIKAAASGGSKKQRKLRIIYVRDLPLLVDSLEEWWPQLLSAVRRRRGNSPASGLSIDDKTIIVIGAPRARNSCSDDSDEECSDDESENDSDDDDGDSENDLDDDSDDNNDDGDNDSDDGDDDDDDDDDAQELIATSKRLLAQLGLPSDPDIENSNREKELQKTWSRWIEGDEELLDDVPSLNASRFEECQSDGDTVPVVLHRIVLVPNTRAYDREAETRVARRRELNILTMKIAASNLGAPLPQAYSPRLDDKMWSEWGCRHFPSSVMHFIVERAMGGTILEARVNTGASVNGGARRSVEISWEDIYAKWVQQGKLNEMRTSWARNAMEVSMSKDVGEQAKKDETIEKVKRAKDLSKYERDMLTCIVDIASMPVSFEDIHLPEQTFDALRTLTTMPLLYPHIFQQGALKQHGMKGALLFGPPGVGKTHLVRALARECGARMLCVRPSSILQKHVGEDEKCVRATFSLARRLSPCIIFIDELDAMFPSRDSAPQYHCDVTMELLQEMDGLQSKQDGVIVIGATNRPFDLDDAVLRRLPLRTMVSLPSESDRETILKIHLRDEELADDITLARLARETNRFSGSDLKHLVVSAALDAAKETINLPWRSNSAIQISGDNTAAVIASSAQSPPLIAAKSLAETPVVSSAPLADTRPEIDPLLDSKVSSRRRVLRWHNFAHALTEIWPSASEHISTFDKLKTWNDKFGSGSRRQGKGELWAAPSDHESMLANTRRAFDLTDDERALLKCAIDPAEITTTFEDIHLLSHTVDTMRTVVSLPLIRSDAFAYGILREHGFRGSLLFGPPGTGKTLIMRALAYESGAHMLAIRPSDINNRYVGESEKRITALFALARRLSPCIIFIDEIDALFPERATDGSSAGTAYRAVLTEFMQDMDGLRSKGENVIVVGATNRPFDLDEALLRRLPVRLLVDLPNEQEREDILKILLRSEKLGDDVDLEKIARDTNQFSGSDLKHLAIGAALEAVKEEVNLLWKSNSGESTRTSRTNRSAQSNIAEIPSREPSVERTFKAARAATYSDAGYTRVLYARHFTNALKDVQPGGGEHTGAHAKIHDWARKHGIAGSKYGGV